MPEAPTIAEESLRRLKQRGRAVRGQHAEQLVAARLRWLGLEMVERIATPARVIRVKGKATWGGFIGKVSGDFRAIVPGTGQSVLIEVKRREDRLSLSDFEPHQISALDRHVELGGLSLVAWFDTLEVRIMEWPLRDFAKGSPLTALVADQQTFIRIPPHPITAGNPHG